MAADRRPLISESSDLSDTTANSTPALPSLGFSSQPHSLGFTRSPPTSPRRPGYSRLISDTTAIDRSTPSTLHEEDEEDDIGDSLSRRREGSAGLGIAAANAEPRPANSRRVSVQSIPRVPVGARGSSIRSPPVVRSPETLSPPNTGDPLFGGFPQDSAASTPDLRRERFSPQDTPGGEYEEYRREALRNGRRSETNDYENYVNSSDTARLHKGAPSIRSAYDKNFRPTTECPTARDFYQPRFTWISITIVIICLFSTVFSGIFLVLALKKPRYGRSITSQGSFTPSDAIILTSILAKLIELSFVTSFVAFLGQVLSRRAFMKEQGRGVTLSELSMWRWVVQPGTLITHWETMKYSGFTVLGILSLLSAVLAALYTPAATALVQPGLRHGKWENRPMVGRVRSVFANPKYISSICPSPIRTDDVHKGSTCLQIEHAGQGYHNYQRYLAYWDVAARNGNGTSDQRRRPQGFGLLYENTTITGQWINIIDSKEESKKHKRAINSVSLAMPHAGVFSAARDQRNGILQPEELNSEGVYTLRASVPSPVMNVLCANMEHDELKPIIYDEWNTHEVVNITTWTNDGIQANATTTNNTVVDDIFGWTKKDKERMIDYPPVFAKYPKDFNTIMNHTSQNWGRDSIYLLGQGGKDSGSDKVGQYVLCKIHVTVSPECSTRYNATGSGGTMEALCEDKEDKLAFIKSYPNATEPLSVPDWRDIGFDWANSLSLNTGIMDGYASNSRLLTQLILQKDNDGDYDLNPGLPSVAEALAVMSGCTLLKSTIDAPFVMFWNYTHPMLDEYQAQYFNASLIAQQYASGGVDAASRGWIIILLLVFLMNIFVLIYFLLHRGLVTDFSEPPNLFALAVNSPPSHLLAGSCGGGPEGKQYMVNWFVNAEGDHLYVEPGEKPMSGAGYMQPGHHDHTHPHTHEPHIVKQPTGELKTKEGGGGGGGGGGGMFSPIITAFHDLRERGLHLGPRKTQTLLRPVSVAGHNDDMNNNNNHNNHNNSREYELEDANSRTQRQYLKLAKRRSML